MSIYQVTYERLFNLGNYESERISAVALVENDDVEGAYAEAKAAVESARTVKNSPPSNGAGATYDPPASDKQRAYIQTLQDKAGWSSEDLLRYASEQQIDLAELTKADASKIIDHLQKEARQEQIVEKWAKPMVTANNKQPVTEAAEDLPF